MQRDNKRYSFDIVIFFLLFGLLPVDMLNGFLLREVQLTPVITISQLYKIVVLSLLFIRITAIERIIVFVIFGLLLLPSFFQVITSSNLKLMLVDAVKVIKYLASFIAFLYFRRIFINKGHLLDRVYKWMFFSFIIIVLNIFLRLFGTSCISLLRQFVQSSGISRPLEYDVEDVYNIFFWVLIIAILKPEVPRSIPATREFSSILF